MKNTLRCCIACILPCGALDVIRIVHSNGRVEEISGTVRAREIMAAHPKHVLKKPASAAAEEHGVVPTIVTVHPDAELQRGKIYFLMPVPSIPSERSKQQRSSGRKKRREQNEKVHSRGRNSSGRNRDDDDGKISTVTLLSSSSDRYLSDILSENLSTQGDRRRGRVAVWRPHLQSISESPTDNT